MVPASFFPTILFMYSNVLSEDLLTRSTSLELVAPLGGALGNS